MTKTNLIPAVAQMGQAELAHRNAMHSKDINVLASALGKCADAGHALLDVKLENRAIHMIKLCKELAERIDRLERGLPADKVKKESKKQK